jgi:hypothetical protein
MQYLVEVAFCAGKISFGGTALSLSYVTKHLRTRFSTFGFLSLFTFVLVFFLLSQNVYSLFITSMTISLIILLRELLIYGGPSPYRTQKEGCQKWP